MKHERPHSLPWWKKPVSSRIRGLLGLIALLVIGYTTAALIGIIERRPKDVALAIVPEEVKDLSRHYAYPLADLWERLRIIGVSAAYLKPQSLSVLIDRGDALHFSQAEAQKWIVAGLVSPTAALRPNSLWIRDRDIFSQVLHAAADRGVVVSTQSLGALWIVNFPEGTDLPAFPMGFDPTVLRTVIGSQLRPAFEVDDAADLATLEDEMSSSSGFADRLIVVLGSGLWRLPNAQQIAKELEAEVLAKSARVAIFGVGTTDEALHLREYAWRLILAGHASAAGGMAPVWRSVMGRGTRLLIIHLKSDGSVEENLDQIRMIATQLRSAGFSLDLGGDDLSQGRSASGFGEIARYLIAIALAILGPLMATRQGLHSLRRFWAGAPWREGAPIPQVIMGFSATIAVALAISSVVYVLLSFADWRLGLLRAPWFLWTTVVPIGVSAVALYFEELRHLQARLNRPLTYRGGLGFMALAFGIWLLLNPRQVVHTLNLRFMGSIWAHVPSSLWWIGPRWREAFVGYPCLTIGLWLYYRHVLRHSERKEGPVPSDPRPWFVVALLGPSSILQVFGYARAPYGALVSQTLEAAVIGLVIGTFLVMLALIYRSIARKATSHH